MAVDNDPVDPGGTGKERALDANTIAGNAAYGEIRIVSTFAGADHGSFKLLYTLVRAFFDLQENADRIPRADLWDILVLRGLNSLDD
jgi:hypothetical protein